MKSLITSIMLFAAMQIEDHPASTSVVAVNSRPAENIFIITLDGFRWQEVFAGADPALINNEIYSPDTATMKMLYWSPDAEGRRKKLLPFFWNVLAVNGQIYGNRQYKNKVNTSNLYSVSYPGYSEIFTGHTDMTISGNQRILNQNISVLEFLNTQEAFKGKVAAFTSWDVFPYILNEKRSGIFLNSGYGHSHKTVKATAVELVNKVQDIVADKTETRYDELTFISATEYLRKHRPRVLYLGLGETDEAAHDQRYDLYLEKAAEADRMITRLWHWVQTTPGYRDKTTFIITTDHGRGSREYNWSDHGPLIRGSSQTWLALIGPNVDPLGEVRTEQQIYQKQIAKTIAFLLGSEFKTDQPMAAAIALMKQDGIGPH